jgi:hypothetical protein
MKKKTFFLVAASAGLLFTSCGDESTTVSEGNAAVTLSLEGSASFGTSTRSTTTPTLEDQINTIAVGVFYSDGSVNTIVEPSLSGGTASFSCYATTSGTPCDIVVVANAPSGTFAGVTTKTDFLAKTVSLTQTSSNLPMSGDTTFTLVARSTNTPTVSLSRLVARIELAQIKTSFDASGTYINAIFTPDKVFMYNAMSVSDVNTASYPTTSAPLNGYDGTTVFASLLDSLTGISLSGTQTDATSHYFYTFSNPSTSTSPTKLIISGSLDINGDGDTTDTGEGYVYYPIVVNKAQAGTTISTTGGTYADQGTSAVTRNVKYVLKATIKGPGVTDPSKDVTPADITLTVEVDPWALEVSQDVVFE